MKLVYISNSRMPSEYAHGLQVMQMCEAFVQNGCDVELIVPKRVNKIKKDPFSYYSIKKRLIDLGISEDKILVAPDGVDLQRFDLNLPKNEARVRLNLPKDKKLIGYVGAFRILGMEKGLDVAILAMKALPIDAILVLVGGHLQDIEYYKNLSHKIGVEKKIILIGR